MRRHVRNSSIGITILGIAVVLYFLVPYVLANKYSASNDTMLSSDKIVPAEAIQEPIAIATHVDTPDAVKAVYMTACAASTPSFRTNILNLIDQTEINAVIVDIKDFSGTISMPTDNPLLADGKTGKGCKVKDMKEFVEILHSKDVYVIGRVTVFQDSLYATLHPSEAIKRVDNGGVWSDKNGLHYLYPGSQKVWDYVIEISNDAYAMGFDEINFDYIRFPSDGDIKNMAIPASSLTKPDIIENFFSYLNSKLKDTGLKTSADLFGMVTTNTDDLGIGQVLERTLPYFDYVCPMVYPSHYPSGFNGWKNPNGVPYELIDFVMKSAVARTNTLKNAETTPDWMKEKVNPSQLRPWLQNFSLGQPAYGADEIRAQIDATYNAGLSSWLLWDASNKYTYTKSALE